MTEAVEVPDQQFVAPELVMTEMAEVGARRVMRRGLGEIVLLSVLAGGYITIGALFSTLLAAGTTNPGLQRLLDGFGFSVGFFIVILTGTLLFTEVNVEMPAVLMGRPRGVIVSCVARLWVVAAVGNFAGALVTALAGTARSAASVAGPRLSCLAGRTIIGKHIPVLLTVSVFVAAGFLHSPANMAYLSLAGFSQIGPGWADALWWGIAPAAVGNILGAFFLVALPYWVLHNRTRADLP